MQPSGIISVNLWQIVVSLLNLVLLFLIIKKFLYKPVKNVLKSRQDKLDEKYSQADIYLSEAEKSKAELERELNNAQGKADEILSEASLYAQRRKEKIVEEAREEAEGIIRQAKAEAELEKKKAESEIKTQIVDVSLELSKKLIEREIKEEDHHKLIDTFISQIGENDEE